MCWYVKQKECALGCAGTLLSARVWFSWRICWKYVKYRQNVINLFSSELAVICAPLDATPLSSVLEDPWMCCYVLKSWICLFGRELCISVEKMEFTEYPRYRWNVVNWLQFVFVGIWWIMAAGYVFTSIKVVQILINLLDCARLVGICILC